MKNILKNNFVWMVIGMALCGATVLASNYIASDIAYTPKDSNWEVSNVAEAIDSLIRDNTNFSNKYLNEETIVGTWVDGRPVYRIVKEISFDKNGNGATGYHTGTHNIIHVEILANGIIYASSPYIYAPDNNGIFVACTSLKSTTATAIYEYIKTTDQPQNS